MNFKQQFSEILNALGFTDSAKKKNITDAQWVEIESSFKEKYGQSLTDAMQQSNNADTLSAERNAVLDLIHATPEAATATGNDAENTPQPPQGEQSLLTGVQALVTALSESNKQNVELRESLKTLASQATKDIPETTAKKQLTVNGPGNSKTHLFGIEHTSFSLDRRWNQVALNPAYATLNAADEEKDGTEFRSATRTFGKDLSNRYALLKQNNLLNAEKLNAGFTNDLSNLSNAGLGDQYVIMRQDALIARLITLQNVYDLYPRRYGVQDRELMTNAFFSEISQAYQEGEVWKGSMELQPEMGHVDDAMAKIKFGPLKEIERKYIGYLNTDGSDPIKWSMIEWQLLQIYTQMVSEQNRRRIRGCYIKPESGVAGSYLNTSTGLIYTLVRYQHENKLLPHSDDAYNDYSNVTFLDSVQEMVTDVKSTLDEDIDLDGFAVYLNKNHKDWWIQGCRAKYGKDIDFSGPQSYANIIPDTNIPIKWVPNMGQCKLIHIQEPGNLQCLEFVPGEMLSIKMQDAMELVKAWAVWKEGFTASFVGKHFATLSDLAANKYSMQRIFCNTPVTKLEANATSIDAANNFWFRTESNTDAKAITDIVGAKKGVVYIIECMGATNPTSIAQADKFSTISSAYTPKKEGDYIMVAANKDGKFIELERSIDGTRTINKELQPNIPGSR